MNNKIKFIEHDSGPNGSLVTFSDPPSVKTTSGEIVHMSNGEVWFHPYSGGKPTRLQSREFKQ